MTTSLDAYTSTTQHISYVDETHRSSSRASCVASWPPLQVRFHHLELHATALLETISSGNINARTRCLTTVPCSSCSGAFDHYICQSDFQ